MHTLINCFPICHHLFDVSQYVFDLAYVIYSKLYFMYWSLRRCIHRTFLYARLKNGMSSVNTCGGLAGGQSDVSAL